MPALRSGLRTASDLKTNASMNIPEPAMAQAIIAPSAPVSAPNRRGRTKTPEPTIDPTTIAVRVPTLTFLSASTAEVPGPRSALVTIAAQRRSMAADLDPPAPR